MTPSLARFFANLTSGWLNRVLIFSVVLFVAAASILYWQAGQRSEKSLVELMLHRQTVLVRAGARSIAEYFDGRERRLLFTASLSELADPKGKFVEAVLREALATSRQPVADVIRVDEDGNVVARASEVGGPSQVSDRDYFIWAKDSKNRGKVYYSDIVVARGGPAKDEEVIVLATPIWQNDKFGGLVAVVVSLEKLAQEFVLNLKVTERSSPFLIDSNGNVLASIFPELVGENIVEYTKRNPWKGSDAFLSAVEKMKAGEDGKVTYVFREPEGRLVERLTAFTPVELGEGRHTWSLGLSVPKEEALAFVGIFYGNQISALVFAILVVLTFSALFILAVRIAQRDAYLDGFAAGRNHEDKLKVKS